MFQQVPDPTLSVPIINRLDGNHRLEGVMTVLRKAYTEGEDSEFPSEFPPVGILPTLQDSRLKKRILSL